MTHLSFRKSGLSARHDKNLFSPVALQGGLGRSDRLAAGLALARAKASYDAIVIGGGGHGLATAYYLARNHNISRVAVLEKGWIGGGNTGRNTTVVRSNYYYPESVELYGSRIGSMRGCRKSSTTM